LHVEELVEIIQCRICTADQTIHSNFEQLVDMLELFTQLPWAPPTYCAQFGPLYILYTEEFPLAVLHARVQYIKQSFHTITVLPDDGPVRPETCSS